MKVSFLNAFLAMSLIACTNNVEKRAQPTSTPATSPATAASVIVKNSAGDDVEINLKELAQHLRLDLGYFTRSTSVEIVDEKQKSVKFVSPQVLFNGEFQPISDSKSSALGFCRLQKFSELVSTALDDIATEGDEKIMAVDVSTVHPAPAAIQKKLQFHEIVCSGFHGSSEELEARYNNYETQDIRAVQVQQNGKSSSVALNDILNAVLYRSPKASADNIFIEMDGSLTFVAPSLKLDEASEANRVGAGEAGNRFCNELGFQSANFFTAKKDYRGDVVRAQGKNSKLEIVNVGDDEKFQDIVQINCRPVKI